VWVPELAQEQAPEPARARALVLVRAPGLAQEQEQAPELARA
jgi:hypothetical protein